jgi:hypothetical protein
MRVCDRCKSLKKEAKRVWYDIVWPDDWSGNSDPKKYDEIDGRTDKRDRYAYDLCVDCEAEVRQVLRSLMQGMGTKT